MKDENEISFFYNGEESRAEDNDQKNKRAIIDSNDEKNKRLFLMDDDNDQKNKSVMIDKDYVALRVNIDRAKDLEDPRHYPFFLFTQYNVVYWVDPEDQVRMKLGESQNPVWRESDVLYLNNIDDQFLHVEVQRFNLQPIDPEPTSHKVVVGRARIPIPEEFNKEVRGTYALVKDEGGIRRPQGYIFLSMRLERTDIDPALIRYTQILRNNQF